MALEKDIRQEDGVVTKYHRILYIQQTPGTATSIAVISYTDEEGRDMEKSGMRPYVQSITYEFDFEDGCTISRGYELLETLDVFSDSIEC